MRGVPSSACVLVLATLGCASQRQTGAALVVAGAGATMVGASAASHSSCSGAFGCYYRAPAPWGSKVAVAGAAVAAAGYAAMATAPRGDAQTRRSPPTQTSPEDAWRLQRKKPPTEPPPESTEEERDP
ncbi:MAG TPA: hypothetical protein VK550_00975 [Polyangiaceae bacterium]|nr:hypothetical protein [Polyangiaceae bacterium]